MDHPHEPRDGGDAALEAGVAREVRAKVAAIGEGTAEAYRRWSRRSPDLVPASFTTGHSGALVPGSGPDGRLGSSLSK